MTKTFRNLPGMYGVLDDIYQERRRQIEAEGWTPQHDDEHDTGAISMAAGAYAIADELPNRAEQLWPWDMRWWKPTDRRRNLVKAGALIVAEIERLDRASSTAPKP